MMTEVKMVVTFMEQTNDKEHEGGLLDSGNILYLISEVFVWVGSLLKCHLVTQL